jgi:hypothetical protein
MEVQEAWEEAKETPLPKAILSLAIIARWLTITTPRCARREQPTRGMRQELVALEPKQEAESALSAEVLVMSISITSRR